VLLGIQTMSEQTTPPAETDVPEAIQWYRLARNYLAREGKVIKEAKITFGVAALALMAASTWATWRIAGALYEERLASKDATIATKDATIDYLKSQVGSPREKTDAPKASEVQLSRLELSLQYNRPTIDKPLSINLFFSNKGTIPSSHPVHSHLSIYTNKVMSDSEIDNFFSQLFHSAEAVKQQTKSNNQLYPNQPPVFWTDFDFYDDAGKPVVIDEAKYKTIIEGDMRLYTFAILYYRDSSTPDKKWRTTEMCLFLYKPGSAGICDSHNTTGMID
jgi:hypothetical protein